MGQLIADLPAVDYASNGGVTPGTAKIEVQIGTGAGSSQHSDVSKLPISDAVATALGSKANSANAALTGNATAENLAMTGDLSGFKGVITQKTGAAYTLTLADNGKIVELSHTAAIAVTLPNNLPQGFNCVLVQVGAGQPTLSAAAGVVAIRHRQGHTKLAGQWAQAGLYIRANANGSTAEYAFAGDTA